MALKIEGKICLFLEMWAALLFLPLVAKNPSIWQLSSKYGGRVESRSEILRYPEIPKSINLAALIKIRVSSRILPKSQNLAPGLDGIVRVPQDGDLRSSDFPNPGHRVPDFSLSGFSWNGVFLKKVRNFRNSHLK